MFCSQQQACVDWSFCEDFRCLRLFADECLGGCCQPALALVAGIYMIRAGTDDALFIAPLPNRRLQ